MSLSVQERRRLVADISLQMCTIGEVLTQIKMEKQNIRYGSKEPETRMLWVRSPFLLSEL